MAKVEIKQPNPSTPFPVWNKKPYATSDCAQTAKAITTNIVNSLTPTVSTIATSLGTAVWFGGTAAPNGMIYFAPGAATNIAKLDPSTDTITLIGTSLGTATNKYMSGALAPNGHIYFIPYRSGNILKLDPTTDTVTQITASYASGSFNGCIVSPQGNIYTVPQSYTGMLKIDTSNDTLSLLTVPAVNVSTGRWNGAIVAEDGKIYMVPGSCNAILEVDPATDTMATYVVYDTALRNQYNGCILGPNGLMYGIPNESFQVMIFNPITKAVSFVSTLGGGGYMYGGTMGPDGVIYAQGWANNTVMGFSTLTNQYILYTPPGKPTSGIQYGGGGVMAYNGNVYLPANNDSGVFSKIAFAGNYNMSTDWALSTQVNHF